MSSKISEILIVDDHWISAAGMSTLITSTFKDLHCESFSTIQDTLDRLNNSSTEEMLVIADFWLSDNTALALLDDFQHKSSRPRVIVLSGDSNPELERMVLARGAWGFWLKSTPAKELISQIGHALIKDSICAPSFNKNHSLNRNELESESRLLQMKAADLGLTHRQGDILRLLLAGKPNKVIARELDIAEQTVKEHVTALLARFSVLNRIKLIKLFADRRISIVSIEKI